MHISIRITENNKCGQYDYVAAVEISDMFRQIFQPINICDDPLVRYLDGTQVSTTEAHMITEKRKDAAKEIAEIITAKLMAYTESRDTVDGYTVGAQTKNY